MIAIKTCQHLQQVLHLALPASQSKLLNKSVSDLYSTKISEENQGAFGMGARGQDRLSESRPPGAG